MSYTLGIPSDGQSLGNSKPQVRGNFTTLFDTIAINHVAMNSLGAGKHKFLQMPEQGSIPSTVANEGAQYTSDIKGSFTNLFWKQESGGVIPEKNQGESIQMTNITPSNTPVGRSFLPGGILIQWGLVTIPANQDTLSVTYNVPFDIAAYSIQLTFAQSLGSASRTLSIGAGSGTDNTKFLLIVNQSTGVTLDVYYMAIGKRET